MLKPCKTLLINTAIALENVQRNKKKEKGEFTGCQVSSKEDATWPFFLLKEILQGCRACRF
jgi:hypothetical protein